jgi:hypothetical protein
MERITQNWNAFILQLIGSLVFLATVFGGALNIGGGPFAGAGAFWAPIFVGAAMIASVALFFASFGYITGMSGPRMSMMGLGTDAIAGLTLTAMTWTSSWIGAAVLGFVLCFLGAAMGER